MPTGKAWLSVNMFLNDSQYRKGMKRAQGATASFTNSLQGMLGLAVVGQAFISATKAAIDFSMAMTKIETLVGIAREEVDAMKGSIKGLAWQLGKDPQELAEGMFFITSAGLRGSEAMEALESATKASALGLGEVKSVADATTSIMNAYGAETISAAKSTELLLKTVRLGKVEAETLAPALGRVIPVAQSLGVSFEEVGANIATVTRVGLGAEEAVVTLRGVMNTFIKPSTQAAEALESVGTNMQELRDMLSKRGLLFTLLHMKRLFGDNVEMMGKVIPNVRALSNFLATTGEQADTYNEILQQMREDTDLVGEGMKRLAEEDGFKLQRLLGGLKAAAITAGDALSASIFSLPDAYKHIREEYIKLQKELNKDKAPKNDFGQSGAGATFDVSDVIGKSFSEIFKESEAGFKDMTSQNQESFKEAFTLGAATVAKIIDDNNNKNKKIVKQSFKSFEDLTRDKTIADVEANWLANFFKDAEKAAISFDQTLRTMTAEEQQRRVNKAMVDGERIWVDYTHTGEVWESKMTQAINSVTEFMDTYSTSIQHAVNVTSQLQNFIQALQNTELAKLSSVEGAERDALEARLGNSASYYQELDKLEEFQQRRRNKRAAEYAKKMKILASVQAIVQGASAAVQALNNPNPVAKWIDFAAVVTASGLQLATINATSIPSFARGTSFHTGGLATVHEGETINLPRGTSIDSKGKTKQNRGNIDLRAEFDREKMILWEARGNRHHSFRTAGL